jgi:RHS repeat-associated protein
VPAANGSVSQETVLYIHTDRLGSQVAITDSKARVVYSVDYKAYGAAVQNQTKAEASGYTGHYEDPLTGLIYMQARYYDADLGRFMSPDPAAVRPGNLLSFGRYVYANANPVNYVDPDGRAAEEAEKANAKTLDQVVVHGSGGGSSGGMPSFVGTSGSHGGGEPGGGGGGGAVGTEETVVVTATTITVPLIRPVSTPFPRIPAVPVWATNPWLYAPVLMIYSGSMAECQEPACMPGLYQVFPGVVGGLTGGSLSPVGGTYPPGSLGSPNGVIVRRPVGGSGPRIDVPGNGSKPPETIHFPAGTAWPW